MWRGLTAGVELVQIMALFSGGGGAHTERIERIVDRIGHHRAVCVNPSQQVASGSLRQLLNDIDEQRKDWQTHRDAHRQTNRQTAGGRVTNTFLGRHVVVPAVHPWFETIRYEDIDNIILHWNFSLTNLVCLSTCSRVLMVDVYSNCAVIIRWNTRENKSAQPRASAVNMTLPACAAERRAAALCHRSTAAGDRTVSELLLRRCNGTDGRTDGHRTVT